MATSGGWESLDPAGVSTLPGRNMLRNYGRTLLVFKSAPGASGARLVPDLATSLGKVSDDGMKWTYTLRTGLTYEDGSPITSKDIKYAVERSLDRHLFPAAPSYFRELLDLKGYTSAYRDKHPERLGLTAIETPDDLTIVFRLKRPYAAFDFVAQLPATVPVPRQKDTAADYSRHVVSSGPYKIAPGVSANAFTLVRNVNYQKATDPDSGRRALPDQIAVQLNVPASELDRRLLAGQVDVDLSSAGVDDGTRTRIAADPKLKAASDVVVVPRTWYVAINPDVAPFDELTCRQTILYAASRSEYQIAYGGQGAGQIATSLLPPIVPGPPTDDFYHGATKPWGDENDRTALDKCSKPQGFTTTLAFRSGRRQERAAAEGLKKSLAEVRINVQLVELPADSYYNLVGDRDYARSRKLGMIMSGQSGDPMDGFAFLAPIVDSRSGRPGPGNRNLGVHDPAIDALFDQAEATVGRQARDVLLHKIDATVMLSGYALPGVWPTKVLVRPPTLTNVFVNDAFNGYDYTAVGTSRR